LTTIKLNENQITDEGVKSLAAAAEQLSNLTQISLMKNKITAKGMQYLAD
jgi:hypothetical protein